MRVTNSMMISGFLRDTNKNLSALNKANTQLNSGKNYIKPSDNSKITTKLLNLKSELNATNQYKSNIEDTINYLDESEISLDRLNNSIQQIRELMVSAGDAGYGSEEFNSIKIEINERVKEISDILNSTVNGNYIFGGAKNSTKPINYTVDANGNCNLYFSGINGEELLLDAMDEEMNNQLENIQKTSKVEIANGVYVDYGVNVIDLMVVNKGNQGEINFMQTLNNMIGSLDSETEINNSLSIYLDSIDKFSVNLNEARSNIGVKINRLEDSLVQNEDIEAHLTELISGIQDVDYVQKSIEVNMLQTMYVASLQTSSYIMQTSLLDFIK